MRAFLAIPLPEEVRRKAAAARGLLVAERSGWRFAREDGLHLTLRFLGDVDPSRRESLDAACRDAARGTGLLPLRLRGASVVPAAGRPRVLWLPVFDESPDGSLDRLARRVEQVRAEGFDPEQRPFAAHVTLARARRGARLEVPSVSQVGDLGAFVADRLVLFRSVSERGGSTYLEEASFPLAAEVAP
jgi:2'-5' RNA ligase